MARGLVRETLGLPLFARGYGDTKEVDERMPTQSANASDRPWKSAALTPSRLRLCARLPSPMAKTQHSLPLSLLMHLAPGVAILLLYVLAVPMVNKFGLHAEFAMYVSFFFAGILLPLGYLYYLGRKENGSMSLRGIVLYRDRIPPRQYILIAVFFVAFAFYAAGLSSLAGSIPASLKETIFSDLPRWSKPVQPPRSESRRLRHSGDPDPAPRHRRGCPSHRGRALLPRLPASPPVALRRVGARHQRTVFCAVPPLATPEHPSHLPDRLAVDVLDLVEAKRLLVDPHPLPGKFPRSHRRAGGVPRSRMTVPSSAPI